MAEANDPYEFYLGQVKLLLESAWERKVDIKTVEDWLAQFKGDPDPFKDERLQALFLLSQFMYFGLFEVRALLKSLYRDHYEYGLIQEIRAANVNVVDRTVILAKLLVERKRTRFVALGNPSESGAYLLYLFRQENSLPKNLFIAPAQVFRSVATSSGTEHEISDPGIRHYVLIDDLCGSGTQAEQYSVDLCIPLKALALKAGHDVRISYIALFGTTDGMSRVRKLGRFDQVDCVVELDKSFQCFSAESRYYANEAPPISRTRAEAMARKYGARLCPGHPLGYKDGQLLLGFSHNTPDNSLPIFSYDGPGGASWTPIFKRYPKV